MHHPAPFPCSTSAAPAASTKPAHHSAPHRPQLAGTEQPKSAHQAGMEPCLSPSALAELLAHRLVLFGETSRVSVSKLERLFDELGCSNELEATVSRTMLEAEAVWTGAVQKWEQKTEQLRTRVEEALQETAALQHMLEPGVQHAKHDVPLHATVREALDHALSVLGVWRQRKQDKMVEYEGLQMSNTALRQQLGVSVPSAKPDLSKAGFDFLHLEHERLVAERERRLGQLHEEMHKLSQICGEVLGEDVLRVAAQVHPSLRHYSEDMSGGGAAGSSAATEGGASAAWAHSVDLSDTTLEALRDKTAGLHVTRAEREAQLQQLQDVLVSLWEAQHVPDEAPERATFTSAMSGPSRLHAASLDKVAGEVRRLEENRTQSMRDLTLAKARELQSACAATHMPVPSLQDILADLGGAGAKGKGAAGPDGTPGGTAGAGSTTPGQISECLGRVLRALADVNREAARRQQLVQSINEVQVARVEAAWLRDYEADPNRFKGRDATSRLQRSLKAQRLRETLPGLVGTLQRALESWQLTQGTPFLYDGQDYMAQLQEVQTECANSERDKAHLRAQLTQRSTRPSSTHAAPLTPASAAKLPAGRAASMLTPSTLKKGVSVQLTAAPGSMRRVSGNSFASVSTQFAAGELAAAAAGGPAHPPASARTPIRSPSLLQTVHHAGSTPYQAGSGSKAGTPVPPLPQSTPPPPLSSGQQTPAMRVTSGSNGGALAATAAQPQQSQHVAATLYPPQNPSSRTPQPTYESRVTRSTASSGGAPTPMPKQTSEGGVSSSAGSYSMDKGGSASKAGAATVHMLVTPESEVAIKQRARLQQVAAPAPPPSAPPKVSRIPRFSFT